ncbi:hypothetical protein C804_04266 [Lachnospiraceae bacterium A4]|nr:hypothetical protein C804_04266 [Lachnospiraceae bacterium A4]
MDESVNLFLHNSLLNVKIIQKWMILLQNL